MGNIKQRISKKHESVIQYQARICCQGHKLNKTFKTYEEAFNYIKEYCIQNNLVKNIIYDKGDYYEMTLTQGKTMLFDKEDLDILDTIVINAHQAGTGSKRYYAETMQNDRKLLQIHRLIYQKHFGDIEQNLVIDHISNEQDGGLDNRKLNLRIATHSLNMRNAKNKNNKTGITGLYYSDKLNSTKKWHTQFRYNNQIYKSQYYTNKEEAVAWMQNKQKEIIPEEEILTPNRLQ